jgi:hypothetical protein
MAMKPSVLAIALWLSVGSGCRSHPAPAEPAAAAPTSRPSGVEPQAKPAAPHAQRLFAFRSGFWLNLHQWLHRAATEGGSAPPAPVPTPAFAAAVDLYRTRFGARGPMALFFDPELVALGRRSSELGSVPEIEGGAGIDDEIVAILRAAGREVRADWDEHDRLNRAWIAELEQRLDHHGEALGDELAAIYGTPWPAEPIIADVACFAGPFGAYTVEPAHITISRCDPRYGGDAALEMIFHEASHLLVGPIEKELEAIGGAPPELWHAIIFYSAGALTARRLGSAYVPFAAKNGLWARGGMRGLEPLLAEHWQPYLAGKVDRRSALEQLVAVTRREPR